MYDGVINLYKESGYTSHDAVAKLRGILGQKKAGHTGTLDPQAEGVLLVCVGKGTRLCDMLTEHDKTYRATMLLGVDTDTQDMEGSILREADASGLDEDEVTDAILSFKDGYEQIPPMYSAVKVGGRKLYELARKGIEAERSARQVRIYDITVDSLRLPEVDFTVSCSRGTYIRALCHDIGERLGVGGCLKKLLRTRVGGFRVEDSLTIAQIAALKDGGRLSEAVVPVETVLKDYPQIRVADEGLCRLLRNGNPFPGASMRDGIDVDRGARLPYGPKTGGTDGGSSLRLPGASMRDEAGRGGRFRVYDKEGTFIGVYEYKEDKDMFFPWKVFL